MAVTLPSHLTWLVEEVNTLKTASGQKVKVFNLLPNYIDKATFSAWATHFRGHYCEDHEIDILREGSGLSREDYLTSYKFPEKGPGLGPGIRSGDFAEILISDFIEFILNHWVPRTRYRDKTVRNESTKGSDVIGFKELDPAKESPDDVLTLFEVKAQLSEGASSSRLQDAINDSKKDQLRIGESLHAIKQRLMPELAQMKRVSRYQNVVDRPYKLEYGAAAVIDLSVLTPLIITEATTVDHPDGKNMTLMLIIIEKGMELVHHLYSVAAHEA
jgi:hypothetical protein